MDDSRKQIKVNLPQNISVLYTDATYLTVSQYGVVLDIGQTAGPTNEQNIVARVGMSKEHAEVLVEKLGQLLASDKLRKQVPLTQTSLKRKVVD